ncbi:protein kinase [Archangium violaceum]|uniref:protein kinase domain-containing protein n=1 Tax=Archangium violaceum TaxID=83451 RepID=UPI00194DEF19|nr:protein kinase [Archangium violaceum]QRN96973.1 protein kinase [Archangium violaceum]
MSGNTGRDDEGASTVSGFEDSDFGDDLMRVVTRGPALLRTPVSGQWLGGQDGRRFQVLESLGGGGMGQVFRAWDAQLRREVALKFLLPRAPSDDEEQLISLLRKEARAVAQLAHANIVRLFDVSEWREAAWEPRVPFLVMEYLEGESLSAVLRREQRLAPRHALELLAGIAAGLAHAHEHHVIHRDLKPGNVFVTRQGEVKLLDFGLAWLLAERDAPGLDLPTAGTPAYMAPEQWRGGRQDERTDLWAAGIVLYEMLTGAPPYPSDSLPELRERVLSDEPVPPVRERRPELPRELEPLVSTLLAKAPERRYQTARELGEELRELEERWGARGQAPRPPAPERRQVTLVSLRLTGAGLARALDTEDVGEWEEAFHQRCEELVQQRGGSIALYLGDEVLACFGYPVASEEDSRSAVQVGLALAREALAVKVGIHTGRVTLGGQGPEDRGRALAMRGEAPKVASWLAGLAEPHTVLVSEATWSLVRGTFEAEALGARDYQGLAGTRRLGLHRVLRERPATFRFERVLAAGGLTPLVGREDELRRLLAYWNEARGGRGASVLVLGEAGLGKSRLIQELRERVRQEPCVYFQCQCWPRSSTSPFHPLIELSRRLLPRGVAPPPGTLGLSPEHASLLAHLLSLPDPTGAPPLQLSLELREERTFEAVAALLSHVARERPVLGVVEDLHWADPSTLELLGYLLERLERERVLLVLSARPELHPSWPSRPWMHRLALERLPPELTATLVRESAHGRELSPEQVQQLVARTDGIPLFVEEMTRMVLEHGTPGAIPITLDELLRARLDLLPSRQKALAWSCAALGRGFSVELLTTLTRRDPLTLRRDLEALVAEGLLQPRDDDTGPGYQFRHALLQDAARESQPRGAHRQLHQRITRALLEQSPEVVDTQPERLAYHYTEAGDYSRAIAFWTRAGQRASLRSPNQEAASHFQQALRLLPLLPDTPWRLQEELRLLILLGVPLAQVHGYYSPEVERTYTRALALLPRVGEALPRLRLSFFGLFSYFFSRTEYARAHELATMLVTLGERHEDQELLALGHRMMAADFFAWGDMAASLEQLARMPACSGFSPEEQRAMAERQWIDPCATGLAVAAMAHAVLGHEEESLRASQEALELAERIGHAHTSASVLTYIAEACQLRGDVRRALDWSYAALAIAREHGFRGYQSWATIIRGWAWGAQGHAQEGLRSIREALTGWDAPGARTNKLHMEFGVMAELHLKLGQPREALAMSTEALRKLEPGGQHFYDAELHRLRGEALRALGHEPEARESFLQALRTARQQGARTFERRALERLGEHPLEQHV